MNITRTAVGAVVAVALVGILLSVFGGMLVAHQISNTGSISAVGVGVYSDIACTSDCSSVDWGVLDPGVTKNATVYVRNEGNVAVALSMIVNDWVPPSASNSITLSWNREGYSLSPGLTVQAVLTLAVASNITEITSFGFNVTITGTE